MDRRWARLFGINNRFDESDVKKLTFGGCPLPLDRVLIARDERGSVEFAWVRFNDESKKNYFLGLSCDDGSHIVLTG